MEYHSENDVSGIVEEMAEDRGRTMNRANAQKRGARASSRGGSARTLLFGGIAAVVLLAAFFLLMGNGDRREGDEAWQDLAERLERIELRLDRLEETAKQVPAVIGRMEGLGKSMSRLESDQRTLLDRMDRLSRRLEDLAKAPPEATPSTAPVSGKAATHTVERGETLFSIAKRYGLSVEELCRLNGIQSNDVIQPGQRLVVGREQG